MSTGDAEFLKKLRATFKIEAEEHLQVIIAALLELEKTPTSDARPSLIETVYRAAHSLKGAARAVDFIEIESLCQSLEETFAAWKREKSGASPTAFDAAHQVINAITTVMSVPDGSHGVPPAASALDQPVRPPKISVSPSADAAWPAPPAERSIFPSGEAVRIPIAKLDARLVEAEEMLTVKLVTGQRAAELRELAGRFDALWKTWAAIDLDVREPRLPNDKVSVDRGRGSSPGLTRLRDFLDWSKDYLKSIENTVAALGRTAEQDHRAVGTLVDDLIEGSKKLLLLPFAAISASFPKVVRDLCRSQGKEADLKIRGDDIEIDKRILDEIKDPLVHLLRNSIDHGIAPPAERAGQGKPARASISLVVSQINGGKVQLLLSDDGLGIDANKVKDSAVRLGLITADEASRLGESAAQALIFQSEVTTSTMITRLSGRGLGLAIVREKVEKLGGEVTVESRQGIGTTFRIIVPALRATFRGVLVEAAGQVLVVPTAQVERVAHARPDEVRTVEGRETISSDGRAVALVQLAEILELPPGGRKDTPPAGAPVIVLGSDENRVAFGVDAVLGEQEVLIKSLRKPLSRVRNVAAATVLGSGQMAPVLNVADLLKSARKAGGGAARVAARTEPAEAMTQSILVAEDSITSRMLLKSILESTGYQVKTAVDGLEAFTLLRAEHFDLVVSDVEMPRLNGFDLIARIRADQKLADLPVVLVTALETPEDRERGIDVGANAYLVKSSFDQSNLIEAVRRLI